MSELTSSRYELKPWTDDEDKLLRGLYDADMTVRQIAQHLERSYWSVYNRLVKLKVERRRLVHRTWTSKEVATLRALISEMTIPQMAKHLRRSYASVAQKVSKLKLRPRSTHDHVQNACKLLWLLSQCEPRGITVSDVSQQLGWNPVTTRHRLQRLVTSRHVTAYRGRRGWRYRITPSGKKWCEELTASERGTSMVDGWSGSRVC